MIIIIHINTECSKIPIIVGGFAKGSEKITFQIWIYVWKGMFVQQPFHIKCLGKSYTRSQMKGRETIDFAVLNKLYISR